MDRGWVKLHRKINGNVFLQRDNNAYIVFTKLLTRVNSSGQWAGGRHQLAEITNVNSNTVYKVLKRLKSEHLITISSNTRYSVISICNWSTYQQAGNTPNQLLVTAREQPGNSQVTAREHSNKNKEYRIKNKKPSKIDDELATKEQAAKNRNSGTGYKKAVEVATIIKQRSKV